MLNPRSDIMTFDTLCTRCNRFYEGGERCPDCDQDPEELVREPSGVVPRG